MKKISITGRAAGALVVLAMSSAYAQGSQSDAAVSQSSSSVPSAKAVRKADRLLAKDVRHTLVRVKDLDSSRMVVFAKNGVVTLGGSVPEAKQIEVAVSAAKGVKGVNAVNNSLIVKATGQ